MWNSERKAQDCRFWRTREVWRFLRVEIAAGRTGSVVIVEHYGYRGEEGGRRWKKSALDWHALSGQP